MKSKRTYYITEGRYSCRQPAKHYDCNCGGYDRPTVITHRPSWPASLRYVKVRASTEGEALDIATTVGGRSICAGVGIRVIGSSKNEVELIRSDYDVL